MVRMGAWSWSAGELEASTVPGSGPVLAERVARSGSTAEKVVKSCVPRMWRAAWLRASSESGHGQGQTYGARVGGQMFEPISSIRRKGSELEVRGSSGAGRRGKMRYRTGRLSLSLSAATLAH